MPQTRLRIVIYNNYCTNGPLCCLDAINTSRYCLTFKLFDSLFMRQGEWLARDKYVAVEVDNNWLMTGYITTPSPEVMFCKGAFMRYRQHGWK